MSISKAFEVAFDRMADKGWDKIYVMVDIHDTILRACYEQDETFDYLPLAREALRRLTRRDDICLILWTACDRTKLDFYMRRFEHDGIHFEYANCNPEVQNTHISCFDDKFYFNVGIDDKFGFDGDTDWAEVLAALDAHPVSRQ